MNNNSIKEKFKIFKPFLNENILKYSNTYLVDLPLITNSISEKYNIDLVLLFTLSYDYNKNIQIIRYHSKFSTIYDLEENELFELLKLNGYKILETDTYTTIFQRVLFAKIVFGKKKNVIPIENKVFIQTKRNLKSKFQDIILETREL